MKLFGLLIGIDNYAISKLNQCVNDINKVENYLNSLQGRFNSVNLKKLTNENATKENIVDAINSFLSQAGDADVALLYYSGHGAQEESLGRFIDEQTGLIDCLVAYDGNRKSGFLLADKELRFLFSKFKNNPHLVTVFDCCHSGDIVRNFIEVKNDETQTLSRRLNGAFPARKYPEFIFSGEIAEGQLKHVPITQLLPYKNSVHIGACHATESSWEDAQGGVFTRYLLQLLKAKDGRISYQDITKWAKISLRDMTRKKQTPIISVQGAGAMGHYSAWLKLYPESELDHRGKLLYNQNKGWHYTKGELDGVKKGMEITVKKDKNTNYNLRIDSVNLEDSLVEDPLAMGIELDYKQSYPVISSSLYANLHLCLNNFDFDEDSEKLVLKNLEAHKSIKLVERDAADFAVNIFNQTVYVSLPQDEFRPLALQLDLLNDFKDEKPREENFSNSFSKQLSALIKWNHYNSLENPDTGFAQVPIKVEIRTHESQPWQDVTNSQLALETQKERTQTGEFYQHFQAKVTNTGQEDLYVSCLALSSDVAIASDPFDNLTKFLKPGQHVQFYQHLPNPSAGWVFDTYKEVYNWEFDWLNLKFIVNNYEDLTPHIPEMLQNGLPNPKLLSSMMGMVPASELKIKKNTWAVYTTTLQLKNPTFNIISGDLERNWENYKEDEVLAPFISKLYFNTVQKGYVFESENKPNATADPDVNTKNMMGVKKFIGNFLDDKIRLRKFRKFRNKNPHLPIVVAEGDSWFLYPFLVKDTLDYVMEKYPLRSLAAAGDELQNYKKEGQLLKEVEKLKPKYVLISGGGNDIIGPAIVEILKNGLPPGLSAKEYLNEAYNTKMKNLDALYHYFFNELDKFGFVKQVFVHGYDFVLPDHDEKTIKNGWVNRYLIEKGIKNSADRKVVIDFLINEFNTLLETVTKQHKIATYLNMRTLIGTKEWFDEIHPNDVGFAKVGNKFIEAINQLETVTV